MELEDAKWNLVETCCYLMGKAPWAHGMELTEVGTLFFDENGDPTPFLPKFLDKQKEIVEAVENGELRADKITLPPDVFASFREAGAWEKDSKAEDQEPTLQFAPEDVYDWGSRGRRRGRYKRTEDKHAQFLANARKCAGANPGKCYTDGGRPVATRIVDTMVLESETYWPEELLPVPEDWGRYVRLVSRNRDLFPHI